MGQPRAAMHDPKGRQVGELKHLSSPKKREPIPLVAASERGTAQTSNVPSAQRCVRGVVRRMSSCVKRTE